MTSDDRPSFGDKFRYQLDRFLSFGPIARVGGLFGVSFLLILVWSVFARLLVTPPEGSDFDFLEAMWWTMTRIADAGTMGDDQGTAVRFLAILATLSGLCVVALLFGLVSGSIGEAIDGLRKGKSPVIDAGHSLILGYSEKVFAILRELREANSNQKDACIVILSPADKEEVENAVKDRMGDMWSTRVVVRQGLTWSVNDLKKVGAGRARSIIILSAEPDEEDADVPGAEDMGAIKTLLALRRVPGAMKKNHAVVELRDAGRRSVVEQLGAGGVEVVAMEETLSRMMVQTARQNSLAQVYRDLLSYEGSEFYFKSFPELAGRPFSEVQWKMKDAVVVGVRRPPKGEGDQGATTLNPPEDFVLETKDELLVLAEDDDTFGLSANHQPRVSPNFQPPQPLPQAPDRLLILNMSQKLADMLKEYDNYVLPGSEAWLMPGTDEETFTAFITEHVQGLKRLKLKYLEGDPTSPESLQKVAAAGSYSAALLVAQDGVEPDEADARTVIAVLLLRDLFKASGGAAPRIISEILDARTKELLEQDIGADFVVSNEMTSMLLAQISERRDLNAVFADLFDSDGNEVYLKRAECFAAMGEPTPWLSVLKVARSRGEVALGYARLNQVPVLNPPQAESLVFNPGDRVVVVSEDEREALNDASVAEQTSPYEPAITAPGAPSPAAIPAHAAQTLVMPPSSSGSSHTSVTDPNLQAHRGGTPAQPVPKLAPPPGVKIPAPRPATQPPADPRAVAAERATTGGGRVAGPSQAPRAPLPPKPKA
jgi:ion channel POLLUX/CASTOR